jgi:hypothetical protein
VLLARWQTLVREHVASTNASSGGDVLVPDLPDTTYTVAVDARRALAKVSTMRMRGAFTRAIA